MRSMGYAAAVAAGLIVPLAFVLPTSVGAQTLALNGVSHFVGNLEGDDNDDGDWSDYDDDYDNGDDNDRDNGPDHHDDDRDDSDPELTVYVAGLTSSGDVAFVVRASDVGAFDDVTLESPGLDTGCASNDLSGATEQADRFGDVVFSVEATECIPGDYKIALTEDKEEAYFDDVTIH